jgi:hypothetical protein
VTHSSEPAALGNLDKFNSERGAARWTPERIARLGFLLGLGWDAKRVAGDPIIASTPNNVFRQAQRFGLGFRAAAAARREEVATPFKLAAAARGITEEMLIDKLLAEIDAAPALIDNILDDLDEAAA